MRPRARETSSTISIHALREEGDSRRPVLKFSAAGISIHALREEGDPHRYSWRRPGSDFNPRPPRGGRHIDISGWPTNIHISIHALREEGDIAPAQGVFAAKVFQSTPSARRATQTPAWKKFFAKNFNPRPPRGGRPKTAASSTNGNVFQSTPSARRATKT